MQLLLVSVLVLRVVQDRTLPVIVLLVFNVHRESIRYRTQDFAHNVTEENLPSVSAMDFVPCAVPDRIQLMIAVLAFNVHRESIHHQGFGSVFRATQDL